MDDSDIEGFDKFVEENWGLKVKDGYAGVEEITNKSKLEEKKTKKEVAEKSKAKSTKTSKATTKKTSKAK